jgi:serine/threonine protein phosphatase PrpC
VQRSASQQFVILATDGLWDVVSSQVCGEGKEEEEEEEEFLSKEEFLSSSSSFICLYWFRVGGLRFRGSGI